MHGVIGMLNRKGRKRKSGRRTASGRVVRQHVDCRALVAAQPHRNWLPEALRTHERAENVLGCLNLLKHISEHQYEAGRRYGVIVAAYRQAIGTPRGTGGNGRGYVCVPATCLLDNTNCLCEVRTANYRDCAHVLHLAGQRAYNATHQVVVHEQVPNLDQLNELICGLSALSVFMGLTARRKSA